MTFASLWRDSLSLFSPKNGKLFFLVTIKTVIHTYSILFVRLWWVILLDVLFFLSMMYVASFSSMSGLLIDILYFSVINSLLLFLVIVAMRPSVQKKDTHYFFTYMHAFIPFFLFVVGMQFVGYLFALIKIPFLKPFFLLDTPIILSPFAIFFALFLLDTHGTLRDVGRSVMRSLQMVWYNYPFCLIGFLFFCYGYNTLVVMAINYCSVMSFTLATSSYMRLIISFIMRYLYLWICIPIPLAFFVNFYVSVIYKQLSLYIPVVKRG